MSSRTDRRTRCYKSRAYRRRRLVALLAFIIVVALIAGAVYAVAHRGGSTPSAAASTTGGKATAAPTGQSTPSASSSASPKPSPTTSAQAAAAWTGPPSSDLTLHVRKVIVSAAISPKSVVSTGTGLVFAQNMMYRHTITVYDTKTFRLVKTIPDRVVLADFGYKGKTASIQGAPVEAAETPDHRFMYVSQYSMYGPGFYHEGHDVGGPSSGFDKSFVYRVRLSDLKIDKVIKVGSVPKYLAVTPDQKYLLVSNWDSYTLSVVDVKKNKADQGDLPRPVPAWHRSLARFQDRLRSRDGELRHRQGRPRHVPL